MSSFSNYDSTVNSFYLAFYGRPADPAGLKFWSMQLANSEGNLGAITQAFSTSEEAQVRFGGDDLTARITDIYQQLFNRAPEAEGLAYWTSVVEQGHASLADVSVAILEGAQGADHTLSDMRQKAADAFTAAVEADGTEYSGYASVEAARVLVRAVTLAATDADLDVLVKAAVSFADTATKSPKVVEAIAVNTTLLALFDTTRGKGDPVALAQALADTAKAAAGDPVTLESLLRGGGMDKVLKVMPAAASLKDVVKALADGGLPAAVDVVYPPSRPVDPTPVKGMQLEWVGVSQSEDDLAPTDNVTNMKYADVTFKYTGPDLKAGQQFQYSTDGKNWHLVGGKDVNPETNTVIVSSVDLAAKLPQFRIPELLESSTTVMLQAVEGTRVIASAEKEIRYDASAPDGDLSFLRIDGGAIGDNHTSAAQADVAFRLDGAGADAIVQWRIAGESKWTVLDKQAVDGVITLSGIDLSKADPTVEVRLIDAAGNVGDSISQPIDGPAGGDLTPTFTVMPSHAGLKAGANVAGMLELAGGKSATSVKTSDETVQDGFTVYTIGAQDAAVTGTLQFKTDGGAVLLDEIGGAYTLGTKGADWLVGSAVWGFDGDDNISGTANDDYLSGGAGNDTINGGMGKDQIAGGQGADLIDVGADQDPDRVLYAHGDAAGAVFVDGGSTDAMDKISAFGIGDTIAVERPFHAGATVQSTYLASGASQAWAVVRGTESDGKFTAGASAGDDDYMVQWGDGEHVNSVIVRNYGVQAPLAMVGGGGNALTFAKPETAVYLGSNLQLSGDPSHIVISTSKGGLNDTVDPSGFALYDYAALTEVPAIAYTNPVTVSGTVLHFSGVLDIGLYKMSWDTGTFTSGSAVLASHDVVFAGGVSGNIHYRGIELSMGYVVDGPVFHYNYDAENHYFVWNGETGARVQTGGGYDVVSDNGGKLTIVYDVFDNEAHDIILGFDHGEDVISFEGDAAIALDKDANGKIDWAVAPADAVLPQHEGVVVTVDKIMHFGPGTHLGTTAYTLEAVLDVSAIAQDDHLLLLVRDGTSDNGALLLYTNTDGNGTIEHGDLATIAVFNNGLPDMLDIEVVGTNQSAGGIP